jgi:hypothetical protein
MGKVTHRETIVLSKRSIFFPFPECSGLYQLTDCHVNTFRPKVPAAKAFLSKLENRNINYPVDFMLFFLGTFSFSMFVIHSV